MEDLPKRFKLDATDEDLIQQFKDGNSDTFTELYRRYLPLIFKRVCFVVPTEDVEDIVQETFVAAFKSLKSYRGDSQFGTWLRTLANHKISEYYRRRNRKHESLITPLSAASQFSAGSTAGNLEDNIALRNALMKLPENYRNIILMRVAEDLQFNEIAELLEQNLEAIKSLYRRAITALKEVMNKD